MFVNVHVGMCMSSSEGCCGCWGHLLEDSSSVVTVMYN